MKTSFYPSSKGTHEVVIEYNTWICMVNKTSF